MSWFKLDLVVYSMCTHTHGYECLYRGIKCICVVYKLSPTGTAEGKAAMKRVRVFCGVCLQTRFHSIYRGVTRIAGVVACEGCRHFYQGFNRQPFYADCAKQGRYGTAVDKVLLIHIF